MCDNILIKYSNGLLARQDYTKADGDNVIFWRLVVAGWHWNDRTSKGYRLAKVGTLDTKKLTYVGEGRYSYDYDYDSSVPAFSQEQIIERLNDFVEVDMVLTSGKKLRLKEIGSIARD